MSPARSSTTYLAKDSLDFPRSIISGCLSPSCEAGHAGTVDKEAAFDTIVSGVVAKLREIAEANDATLGEVPPTELAHGGPGLGFRLRPHRPDAAQVSVLPDDAHSIYMCIGRAGWVELLASPRDPNRAVEDVAKLLDAVVAGGVKETLWRRKRSDEIANSLLHIQYGPGGRWHLNGEVSRPLPLVRRLLYVEEVIRYKPYLHLIP